MVAAIFAARGHVWCDPSNLCAFEGIPSSILSEGDLCHGQFQFSNPPFYSHDNILFQFPVLHIQPMETTSSSVAKTFLNNARHHLKALPYVLDDAEGNVSIDSVVPDSPSSDNTI